MGYAPPRHILGALALGLVAACQTDVSSHSDHTVDAALAKAPSAAFSGGDVEAPDVFQVTDTALWDGRPSLGGVWVASPDVDEPERVIMRNSANGKFVTGALFKRERDNPGPNLQISSDAAAALGMLAGQPVSISVTALRRQDLPVPAAAPSAPTSSDQVQVQTLRAPDAPAVQPSSGSIAAPMAPVGVGHYIQIGFFSVEANARRAVSTLAAAGITATIRQETMNGKMYWIVGARGDEAVLARVKSAGFSDAYLTKG